MRTVPALTYQGALKLLGESDNRLLKALDLALGGAILAAGPMAYAGTTAAAFLWGAVDQKNEAVGILHKLVTAGKTRLSRASGRERFELLRAAHTTIVGAAFFEAWQAQLGPAWSELELTHQEQLALFTTIKTDDVVRALCLAEIPMPTAAGGLSRAMEKELRPYLLHATHACQQFFRGLAPADQHSWLVGAAVAEAVVEQAVDRYQQHYLALAVDVREFYIWAALGSQDATFDLVTELNAKMDRIPGRLVEHERALARLAELLPAPARDLGVQSALLRQANTEILSRPPLLDDVLRYVRGLRVPNIEEGYLTPRYRQATNDENARIADDDWWQRVEEQADLETFLAGHLGSPAAVTSPLLVLGDPGSGKSTLTKVLAARLPAERFVVVRVPLRAVTADDRVHDQVQQALDQLTHGRVQWNVLADESRDLIRVVIFDGLDELIQSVGVGRRYLREVEDFQAESAAAGAPVCAVVTSRTLVTGRTWVPGGCLTVKIAEFSDEQVATWLDDWREANERAAAAGTVRLLDAAGVRRLPELARQPLLLLFIALYAADPAAPDLADARLSSVDLYDRLIDNFIRREIDQEGMRLGPDRFDDEVARRRWQLGVTALAMFNRRRTYVLDDELAQDLAALQGPGEAGDAHEVIGQFFFVHAAEANVPEHIQRRRSYEFLHNTLGEYLVAATVLDEFQEIHRRAQEPRRRGHGPGRLDDGLLFALLSHRALTAQPRSLYFLFDLVQSQPEDWREAARASVVRLLDQARRRVATGGFEEYRPQEFDPVRARAAYTANLVLLVTCFGSARLTDLLTGDSPARDWRSMVHLWKSALDGESWEGILARLSRVQGAVLLDDQDPDERSEALLLGDQQQVARIDMHRALGEPDELGPLRTARILLLAATRIQRGNDEVVLSRVAELIEQAAGSELSTSLQQLVVDFLGFATPSWPEEDVVRLVEALGTDNKSFSLSVDYRPLAITLEAFPDLWDRVPSYSSWDVPTSPYIRVLQAMIDDREWFQRIIERAADKWG